MGASRRRSWTKDALEEAVQTSNSIRQVISKLGLIPAGGNYTQVQKYISEYELDTNHFTGKAWSRGTKKIYAPNIPLDDILQNNTRFQTHKLKKRLFASGLKPMYCECCGWAKRSEDGRLPLELDHINGNRHDNRLDNLRILCPNCHSLQPTHRGKNKKNIAGMA